MNRLKIFALFILITCSRPAFAQNTPADINAALKTDDAKALAELVDKDNVSDCFVIGEWQYSLLSQTILLNAKHCFDYLIAQGADVNRSCDVYVPPLMHAVKYGRLDMVKILIAKGAKVDYVYQGQSPLSYAEAYQQTAVADYLRSLKK